MTTKTNATKSITNGASIPSTSTKALVKQVVKSKGLKASKAKVAKPSKVKIVLTAIQHALNTKHVKAISSIENKAGSTLKNAAKDFDAVLKGATREFFVAFQLDFKTAWVNYNKVDITVANKAWSRVANFMTVEKPVSQSPKAKAMAKLTKARIKSGAKVPKAKTGADGRVTPLSVKLQEIKTNAMKRDIYSQKAINTLNFAIAEFEACEKENKALTKK